VEVRPRILYVLHQYPQLSETYIKTEIAALARDYELKICVFTPPDLAYHKNVHPYVMVDSLADLVRETEAFEPAIIHTHWLFGQLPYVLALARETGIPFTVRAHSFDTIWWMKTDLNNLANMVAACNDELCLGVLAFPFNLDELVRAGIRRANITPCWPSIDYAKFYDRSPNGEGIINLGAALPKRQLEDYIQLAGLEPSLRFDLYAIGYTTSSIGAYNEAHGSPVIMHDAVEPDDMAPIYKAHRWLICTASRDIAGVGWPLVIAEAQAAGLGVCMANIRPDMREFVGPHVVLYDDIAEVRSLITGPVPEVMREAGFEHAKKSDIEAHKALLTDLWQPFL